MGGALEEMGISAANAEAQSPSEIVAAAVRLLKAVRNRIATPLTRLLALSFPDAAGQMFTPNGLICINRADGGMKMKVAAASLIGSSWIPD